MVSPSATPITLPDQAQAGQGSTRKKARANQTIELILFSTSQPSRLTKAAFPVSEKLTARAVPAIPFGIRLAWMAVQTWTDFSGSRSFTKIE